MAALDGGSWDLGLRVYGSGFRTKGYAIRVWSLGFVVGDLELRINGFGFSIEGFRVSC